MTSPVNVRIQHINKADDVQLVHVDRVRKFVENNPFDEFEEAPPSTSDPDRFSVGDACKSSNTGAIPPITLPAEPGTLANSRPADELEPEQNLAFMEELWNAPAPLADPGRRIDPPAYNLRPRHELRAPRRYGQ